MSVLESPSTPTERTVYDGGALRSWNGFVHFSGCDWWYHNRGHSELQIMQRVARTHPVLMINSIGMRMPIPGRSPKFFSKILRKSKSMLRYLRKPVAELPDLAIFSPLSVPIFEDTWAGRRATDLLTAQTKLASRCLGLRRPAVLVTIPTAVRTIQKLSRSCVIYNRSDKHSEFTEGNRDLLRRLECELMDEADVVLYVCRTLYEEERSQVGERGILFDHGVDLELFKPAPAEAEPSDLAGIPRPRVGLFGNIRARSTDIPLLEKLARSLPDVQLVLIGDAEQSVGELATLPNVHLLGSRPFSEVPRYGSFFDLALLPYRDNLWVRYSNPIKLKEYIALGLPVICIGSPEASRYEPAVSVARDHDHFIELVRDELTRPHDAAWRAQQRARVLQDSWDQRTREFLEIVERAVQRRANRTD